MVETVKRTLGRFSGNSGSYSCKEVSNVFVFKKSALSIITLCDEDLCSALANLLVHRPGLKLELMSKSFIMCLFVIVKTL